MKKLILVLALTGFIGTGATPAFACEGGKCKMEQASKNKKSKKSKKSAATAESCHMKEVTAEAGKTPACCMKKDAAKAEVSTETKEIKAQK